MWVRTPIPPLIRPASLLILQKTKPDLEEVYRQHNIRKDGRKREYYVV
jgi:hypothetical protein